MIFLIALFQLFKDAKPIAAFICGVEGHFIAWGITTLPWLDSQLVIRVYGRVWSRVLEFWNILSRAVIELSFCRLFATIVSGYIKSFYIQSPNMCFFNIQTINRFIVFLHIASIVLVHLERLYLLATFFNFVLLNSPTIKHLACSCLRF